MGGELRSGQDTTSDKSGLLSDSLDFFKGWDPGDRKPLVQPQGIEITTTGTTPKIDLLYGWRRPDSPTTPAGDRPIENPVANGTLELRYDDPDFDRKLTSGYQFNTLKITGLPPEIKLRHWVDDNGYFFWFQASGENPPKRHHYPAGLKVIEIDGQRQDVDMQRIQVSEAYMAKMTGQSQGFDSMDRRTDVMTYFKRMSGLSESALALEEKILREGVQNSSNPYFRIYLADVLMTQAMKPIIDGVLSGGQAQMDNPETMRKLDEALEMLRQAQKLSYDELAKGNRYPPGNVSMPLAPYLLYGNPYAFWGGSLYQAQRREVALTFIRSLIQSGALNNIELPPALPPR
ncbi:MAG TPA: hypothetical protein V6D08_16470 [Candidatus Obscuribacterales bacterium]